MRIAITGAATGIGAHLAQKLQSDNHEVVAFDIAEPASRLDEWVKTDLSDEQSINNAINSVEGPFDALVNNAGIPPRDGLAELILRVNYFGLKRFTDGMIGKLSQGASIVNTASLAGANWRDNIDEIKVLMALSPTDLPEFIKTRNISATRAYCLSKEAVIVMNFTEIERMIGKGLRMNSVSPAAVDTGILPDFAAAFGERMQKNVQRVGRPGSADEVADVLSFIASAQSSWIKGQDIVVDGGISTWGACDAMELQSS